MPPPDPTLVAYLAASRKFPIDYDTCGHAPLFVTEGDSPDSLARLLLFWGCIWCCVWVACGAIAQFVVIPLLPTSSVDKENHPCYVGQKLAMEIKVVVVASLANVALWDFMGLGTDLQFGAGPLSEIAGVLFISSETADLLLSGAFGFLDPEHIAHHAIHILIGLIIRGNCSPTLTAGILMAQETSGLFLNYYLLMRHRTPSHPSVLISQVLFAGCFFIWRLGIGTFGTLHFLHGASEYLPASFPAWQARVVGAALVVPRRPPHLPELMWQYQGCY